MIEPMPEPIEVFKVKLDRFLAAMPEAMKRERGIIIIGPELASFGAIIQAHLTAQEVNHSVMLLAEVPLRISEELHSLRNLKETAEKLQVQIDELRYSLTTSELIDHYTPVHKGRGRMGAGHQAARNRVISKPAYCQPRK